MAAGLGCCSAVFLFSYQTTGCFPAMIKAVGLYTLRQVAADPASQSLSPAGAGYIIIRGTSHHSLLHIHPEAFYILPGRMLFGDASSDL